MRIRTELRALADPKKARTLRWFFKTGKGQYGEGDRFLGVVVPDVRKLVRAFPDVTGGEIETLLTSVFHEERLLALLFLVRQFQNGDEEQKKEIYRYYLSRTKYINNWDLVDLSAYHIVGAFLHGKENTIRMKLAVSQSLWERRIAIVSTFFDIRNGDSKSALEVAEILVGDTEDLIHKAVGWMLREVGKRCALEEEQFLQRYYKTIPRTMLRYAIERFDAEKRKKYLLGMI